MGKALDLLREWNRRIDRIWAEDGEAAGKRKGAERPRKNPTKDGKSGDAHNRKKKHPACLCGGGKAFLRAHDRELLFILLMGVLLFFLSWILPLNGGPDEEMRYMIPQYIYRHGTLPAGYDPEIRHKIWGISYAFHPILPYILGGYLMRLVGLFHSSDHALLMAARFINVLLGMGFYWYVLQLAKQLFKRRLIRIYFVALLSMLPQLLYLFVYVNTDGIALFSTAVILNYWLAGLHTRWDRRSCTGLAVGVACCALSYFNAYGYALFSVVLFTGSLLLFYRKRGWKQCVGVILKRGIYITVLVFLLTGWWFIRCAILYEGDFLGLSMPAKYGEMYAMEEYKPSARRSVKEQGIPLEEMLRNEEDGGMEWMYTTYRTTIGYFGFMEHPLGSDIYGIHKKLFALGGIGIFLYMLLAVLYYLRAVIRRFMKKRTLRWLLPGWNRGKLQGRKNDAHCLISQPAYMLPDGERSPACFLLLQFSLVCCIIIPILLSIVYSYTDDFQAQGRYIMPMIIPVMYFTAAGTERVLTLVFRKWMVRLLMLSLLYAVAHVFLSAFLSVYIPAYYEPLAMLADLRFPWFSNVRGLVYLMQLLIPG